MKTRTASDFPKKWTGVVEFKSGDNRVKLVSVGTDRNGNVKEFKSDVTSLTIDLAGLPKLVKKVIKPNMQGRRIRVRLNEDMDNVETATPVTGVFPAKMSGLAKKEDGTYTILVKTFNEGTDKENSHLEFIAQYEITDTKSPFYGMELPGYYLPYKFEQDEEEEGMTQFDTKDTPQASKLHLLQSWGEVQGNVFDDPIAWNPDDSVDNKILDVYSKNHKCEFANILETLETRALEADRPVNLVFENGYIKTVQPLEDWESDEPEDSDGTEEESDDEFDEKFPAKKPAKVEEVKVGKTAKKLPKKSDDEEL